MNTTPDSERGTPGWSITPTRRAAVGRGARFAVVAPPSHPLWGLSSDGRRSRAIRRRWPSCGRISNSWRAGPMRPARRGRRWRMRLLRTAQYWTGRVMVLAGLPLICIGAAWILAARTSSAPPWFGSFKRGR